MKDEKKKKEEEEKDKQNKGKEPEKKQNWSDKGDSDIAKKMAKEAEHKDGEES